MGQVFVSDGVQWRVGVPYVQTGTGYSPATKIWVHDGFQWVQRWTRSTTTPPSPDIRVELVAGERRIIRVNVRTPSNANVQRVVLKAGTSWPTNPTDTVGYYNERDSTGTAWSEVTTTQGQELERQLPATYQSFTLPYSTTIYFAAWSQNTDLLWSAASTASITTLSQSATVSGPQTHSAYVYPDTSGSYSNNQGIWRTDNNYVYQGGAGFDWAGLWFYNEKIRSLLLNATSITKMRIYVQRINSSDGVDPARLAVVSHPFASQPSGSPVPSLSAVNALARVGSLNRGQGAWFDIDPSYYQNFRSVVPSRGFALYSGQSTAANDALSAYGQGTESGKVYLEWTTG